jgi:hypothetical protein
MNSLKNLEEYEKERERENDQSLKLYMIIVLISFILGLPFLNYLVREDWDKPNALELLKEKNPKRYEKLVAECEPGSYVNVYMDDFETPLIVVSGFLCMPFLLFMASIFMVGYYLIVFIRALPLLLRMILYFVFVIVIYGFILLNFLRFIEWIREKLAGT